MATITTTITGIQRPLPFNAPQGPGLPLSQVIFNQAFNSTGVGAGDEEDLVINLGLDLNYYYRLLALSVMITSGAGADVAAWATSPFMCGIRSHLVGGAGIFAVIPPAVIDPDDTTTVPAAWGASATDHMMYWEPTDNTMKVLGQLIDGRPTIAGLGPRLRLEATEPTASIGVVSFTLYANFLQYEVQTGFDSASYALGNLIIS